MNGIFVALALLLTAESQPNVALKVRPKFCQSPCDANVLIAVPKHPDNRFMELSWADVMTANGIHASSRINLNGADEVVYHERFLVGLPQGVYNVAIQLFRNYSRERVGYDEYLLYVGIVPDTPPREAN